MGLPLVEAAQPVTLYWPQESYLWKISDFVIYEFMNWTLFKVDTPSASGSSVSYIRFSLSRGTVLYCIVGGV